MAGCLLYSRKIVGSEVHESDDSVHATRFVHRTALAGGIAVLWREDRPVLQGDNGATSKGTTCWRCFTGSALNRRAPGRA